MVYIKNGVDITRMIKEGWTIYDYIVDIDFHLWTIVMDGTNMPSPKNKEELKHTISELLFTPNLTDGERIDVVDTLTTYYSNKWGYDE